VAGHPSFHLDHFLGLDAELPGDCLHLFGAEGIEALLELRRLKNSLRCALVVATFTMRQLRKMNSWISARSNARRTTPAAPRARVEALDGLHQADIAFLDQVRLRQP